MCGIAGYLGYFAQELLFGMAAEIAHRGPDGEGFWSDAAARVGLAHRRLAIIDPSSAAAQPMAGCEGRYQIVFNGEIYNFRELGETLRRYGYVFNPNSDTAVLAPLYDLYGVEMLDMLNGIFAFALWDRETSELLLARDAFGVKPLYYSTGPRGLTFASELKALLRAPGLDPQLSMKALGDYLSYQWSPGERTLFGSIRKLPPGHILKASGKGQNVERWFSPADRVERPARPISARQLVPELRRLIDEVVRDQCVSDAPIGAFLSGGVDSSAVVAAMIAGGHTPAKTYCIGFEGDGLEGEGFGDDLVYAREVAAQLGVRLSSIVIPEPDGYEFETMVRMLDEPEADPAPLFVAAIARAARADGVKVLLGGVGGDDVFSGYRRHVAAAMRERAFRCGETIPRSLLALLPAFGKGALRRRIDKLRYMLEGSDEEFLIRSFEFSPRPMALECLSADARQSAHEEGADWLAARLERTRGRPLVERMLDLELYGFLPDHNLNYTDKAAMAYGVEVRVPLLDKRLVEFAAHVPWSLKTTLWEAKWILKAAVAERLPRSVMRRAKTGFGGPVRSWITGPMRQMVGDVVGSRSFRERGLFDLSEVQRLIGDTAAGRRDGAYLILAIILVELWLRQFHDAVVSSSRDLRAKATT